MTSDLDVLAHTSVIRPRIQPPVGRVDAALLARFDRAYVPDLSDAVGFLYTMDAGIRPLYEPMNRVVGQALTVKMPPGDNLTLHGALGMVEPGDVLVVDSRGYVGGCATGASALVIPMRRGLRGAVVDGAWRDIAELRALEFPVCGRGIAPFSPPKGYLGEINVPVVCGGVVVNPGDIVVGDGEGVVVVPLEAAQIVADSLPDHPAPLGLCGYDIAALERAATRRRRYFMEMLAARQEGSDGGSGPRSDEAAP